MIEMEFIRFVLFCGICHMIWKCFHQFPQEYLHKTSYSLLYTFSYAGYIVSLSILLYITKISAILHVIEFQLFSVICLMIGASGIGIFETIKRKAIFDYKKYGIKPGKEYRDAIIRRNFLIVIEILMLAILIALQYSLFGA